MRTDITISEDVLHWILNRVRLDSLQPEIADNLMKWATGEKKPTFNQIEKTSRATGIPLGYFFLQTPPVENLPIMEYRTINSVAIEQPSRNLIDTIHDMEMIQSWARDYLISEGIQPPDCVGTFNDTSDINECADIIRDLLDINTDWFSKYKSTEDSYRFIRKKISNSGTIVMMNGVVRNNTHRALDINEFRAFAMIDKYAPLIFINTNDSINGRLFSLIHEYAHICMGIDDFFNDRQSSISNVSATERLCNAIAGEILVPQDMFISAWNEEIRENTAEEVVHILTKVFKCGITVIARKALDNHKINGELYSKIASYAIMMYKEYKKHNIDSGGDFYRTIASRIDQRFFDMLTHSVSEGKTLYSDAFRLTNTNRMTYTKLSQNEKGGV